MAITKKFLKALSDIGFTDAPSLRQAAGDDASMVALIQAMDEVKDVDPDAYAIWDAVNRNNDDPAAVMNEFADAVFPEKQSAKPAKQQALPGMDGGESRVPETTPDDPQMADPPTAFAALTPEEQQTLRELLGVEDDATFAGKEWTPEALRDTLDIGVKNADGTTGQPQAPVTADEAPDSIPLTADDASQFDLGQFSEDIAAPTGDEQVMAGGMMGTLPGAGQTNVSPLAAAEAVNFGGAPAGMPTSAEAGNLIAQLQQLMAGGPAAQPRQSQASQMLGSLDSANFPGPPVAPPPTPKQKMGSLNAANFPPPSPAAPSPGAQAGAGPGPQAPKGPDKYAQMIGGLDAANFPPPPPATPSPGAPPSQPPMFAPDKWPIVSRVDEFLKARGLGDKGLGGSVRGMASVPVAAAEVMYNHPYRTALGIGAGYMLNNMMQPAADAPASEEDQQMLEGERQRARAALFDDASAAPVPTEEMLAGDPTQSAQMEPADDLSSLGGLPAPPEFLFPKAGRPYPTRYV